MFRQADVILSCSLTRSIALEPRKEQVTRVLSGETKLSSHFSNFLWDMAPPRALLRNTPNRNYSCLPFPFSYFNRWQKLLHLSATTRAVIGYVSELYLPGGLQSIQNWPCRWNLAFHCQLFLIICFLLIVPKSANKWTAISNRTVLLLKCVSHFIAIQLE